MTRDEAFLNWLAGFIDGEGSFLIYGSPRPRHCRMTIQVRDDDAPIIEEIINRTGIGTSQTLPARGRSNTRVAWQVWTKPDCLALVAVLDEHPLRAKKATDYLIWREAVALWASVDRGADNERVWNALGELKELLAESRVYRGERQVPLPTLHRIYANP